MEIEDFFNQDNIVDLSFFNFRNAITAAYFADSDLRILKVNDNFKSFFPILGNVSDAYFPDVLKQLGVADEDVQTFSEKLINDGKVLIPDISITIDGEERVYSLLSAVTNDESFSYLNGVQGQFVDRTRENELRKQQELLLAEKIRDRELIEEKTKKLEDLANRLAKYLSPQIYQSIFASTNKSTTNFARKNLTVFFSDIEQFTEISDGMEPERLAFVINTYLGEMSNIAIEHGGTIDKFIGDAVMVFFGDPETEGEAIDAIKCARMALRMRQRVDELKDVWLSKGISKPLRVRMGISTGFCTVGNFGSDQRLDYTVLGGPVNLAARLQTAAEPDTILVSETTYLLVRDDAECNHIGEITPKGFSRPVQTYQLNGIVAEASGQESDGTLIRVGEHVEVSISDTDNIREAIIELKRIEEEFEEMSQNKGGGIGGN